ncbi:thiol reductant ABC exporter subunit CydC [Paenibacillus oleatilyticus]|uniref:thiol reductant ABC exporter subunit CydC n=1 Tax=Paenibacillus oleatilyticus TaxID=2594886 RepID=UPI001C1FC1C7|nr:thiol reductant ABC exporter subunit CydC [Paenibacillus oleatilyticus]MBU7315567.1 thiol reductant ABC exporter subunit CydC [Paenibacillus oleatilyticus]
MKREAWLRPESRAFYWRFAAIVALGALTAGCAASLMFTSGYLISKSALRPENILMVYVPIVLVRTFGTSRAVVHYVERLVGHDTILRMISHLRVRLYRLLEPQALFIRSRFRTGDMLGVLADDIEHLQNVYLRIVFPGAAAFIVFVLSVAALGCFDGRFALLTAVYLLILGLLLSVASLAVTRKNHTLIKRQRGGLYRKLTDAVLGMNDWVVSGRAVSFIQSYEADEAEMARLERRTSDWTRRRNAIAQGVVGLMIVSMIYWAGQQAADQRIAATLIAAFVLVVFPVADVFLPLSEAVEKLPQYRESLNRLSEIGQQAGSAPAPVQDDRKAAAVCTTAHLQVDNACYQYEPGSRREIDRVSLDLPQGKKIAIIGRSGAGKSTLLKLIQGALVPTEGQVTVNGIPAHSLGDGISGVISVLNQSPHLFDTSVANNIRLGKPEASDEDIRLAAKLVKLDALIESLPAGYRTPMHETGQRFSGGERQRIALARILLQDTPVVLLDEPTVGLDPRTERDLLSTIFDTLRDKSLIWVTHHLVGAEQMDEMIFMENGRVEMRGTHAELMERYPRYRNLYRLDRPGEPVL